MVLVTNFRTNTVALSANTSNVRKTSTQTVSRQTTKGSQTVSGDTVQTDYGPVQVQVTTSNGKITNVQALQLPSDNPRSQEISSAAAPLLRSEALKAQNASIDTVSGATYTSAGYQSSLQSALDKATV